MLEEHIDGNSHKLGFDFLVNRVLRGNVASSLLFQAGTFHFPQKEKGF